MKQPQIFTTASLPNAICENIADSQTRGPVEVDKNNPVYQLSVDDLSNRGVAESALDQSVDNGFVPRTTEPSSQLNISLVVDSGGNGNMDNHLPPHALGYNPSPESECTTNPNSTRTSHHPLELHYAASGNEAGFVWRNQYESTSSIVEIDADPTMTSALFSRIDPDPTMTSTLFSQIDPDPTMSSTLFSRIDPDPTMSSTLFNSSQVNSNAHTLFERGYLELW
ncbi:hypothetical protein EMCG_04578 [[Emmonsia] crescens]|uniref:Uncharacterized protein n=1 Tax=[Emmonsia] crescens TaxID=73230 RepID=A0A0G2HRU1_9EURO|nr:hypothetical protein EMCG_04578 [Emmonsia crescens UAMH 3008]